MLQDAITLSECGHNFCRSCASILLNYEGPPGGWYLCRPKPKRVNGELTNICTVCGKYFTAENIENPSLQLTNALNEKNLHCWYGEEGCREITPYKFYKYHEDRV